MELPIDNRPGGHMQSPAATQPARQTHADLRAAAEALEAGFLSQMLESAGLGEVPGAFGGGEGEGQFSSFLRQAQAEQLARAGGIGLAESIYASLVERFHE